MPKPGSGVMQGLMPPRRGFFCTAACLGASSAGASARCADRRPPSSRGAGTTSAVGSSAAAGGAPSPRSPAATTREIRARTWRAALGNSMAARHSIERAARRASYKSRKDRSSDGGSARWIRALHPRALRARSRRAGRWIAGAAYPQRVAARVPVGAAVVEADVPGRVTGADARRPEEVRGRLGERGLIDRGDAVVAAAPPTEEAPGLVSDALQLLGRRQAPARDAFERDPSAVACSLRLREAHGDHALP